MTAGSAVVSPDSPAVFGNLLAYKDEIVTLDASAVR
jgi:N-methyl-L-proline demethylase